MRIFRTTRRSWVAAVFALALWSSAPQTAAAQDPEPFRRDDEIEGRDFDYDEPAFLDRFTYRYRPAANWEWERHRSGYRGGAGSVSSDEFYVDQELRERLDLDPWFFFDVRHTVREDFDGHYDRTLTGLGLRLTPAITFMTSAEIVGDKGDIDTQFEFAWNGGEGRSARVELVLTDALLNTKGTGERYSETPYTLFSELRYLHDCGVEYAVWCNASPHTRLERKEGDLAFRYDRYSGGARFRAPLSDSLWLHVEGQGETTGRHWDPLNGAAATDINDRSLQRRHWEVNAELHRPLTDDVDGWIGLRYFRLEERDRRPQDPMAQQMLTRRELMAHFGVIWRVQHNITVWPGIYAQFPDNRVRSGTPDDNERDASFVGKIAIPIEVRFDRPAFLTLNPTFRIDEMGFGGANVQFSLPF